MSLFGWLRGPSPVKSDNFEPTETHKRLVRLEIDFEGLLDRFQALRGTVADDLERAVSARNRAAATESQGKKRKEAPDDAPEAPISSAAAYRDWVQKNGRTDPAAEARLGL